MQRYNPPSNDLPSTSASFHYVSVERRVGKTKVLGVSAHQSWEHRLSLEPFLVIVNIAVHETVTQCRVCMDINVKINIRRLNDSEKTTRYEAIQRDSTFMTTISPK